MYKTDVIIDTDVLDAVKEIPRRVDPALADYVDREIRPALEHFIDVRVSRYPGPVKHPFVFATARSRRAFFASNGFGRGIPTKRTGQLKKSWRLRIDRRQNEGYITLTNVASYAGYIYGSGNVLASYRQVPGHRNTGWGEDLDEDLLALSQRATDMLIDGWITVTDRLLQR